MFMHRLLQAHWSSRRTHLVLIRMPIVWNSSVHYRPHRSGICINFHDAIFWVQELEVAFFILHGIPVRVIEAGHGEQR